MGIYCFDFGQIRSRQTKQTVFNFDNLLTDNIVFKFYQQIINLTDHTRCGIFNRQNSKIRTAFIDRTHRIPECLHMKTIDGFAEIFIHGSLRICTFRSLKYNSCLLRIQFIDTNERKFTKASFFCQHLILQLSAHGHDLLKQFFHTVAVKLVMCLGFHLSDLFFLTRSVKYLFSGFDLILCHLLADIHSFFIQIHDLSVDLINLIS